VLKLVKSAGEKSQDLAYPPWRLGSGGNGKVDIKGEKGLSMPRPSASLSDFAGFLTLVEKFSAWFSAARATIPLPVDPHECARHGVDEE